MNNLKPKKKQHTNKMIIQIELKIEKKRKILRNQSCFYSEPKIAFNRFYFVQ